MSLENRVLADRYRIEQLLARGGMADVYLATDERLDRKVAVKVIYPHLASDPRFSEKLIREAKTAAKLNHPNLVNVFDQGTSDGQTYMVMEYVPGMTLRQALDKFGRLSPSRALDALDAVLQGLAAAHRAGILHRDLKPENVFLADDGRIKLGDFGLAREANAHTNTGSLMGTIAYIAPELLTRGHADARSDVYSAGIMLFEFLTGSQPFGGTDIAHIAHQHTAVGVPAPSTLVAEIPPLLDELVLWATAMAPQHRPANAQVLAEVMQRVRAELKAGNGATARLDLPEFAGLAATKVISVDGTMKLGAAAVDENGTVLIGDEYLPDSGATGVMDGFESSSSETSAVGATTVIGNIELGPNLHPLEELAWRRRKRGKWIAGAMVLVTLLASGAGWWFSAGPGGMTALPDLSSSTLGNAQKFLGDYTGDVGVTKEYSNTVTNGLVTRTEPKAGQLFWRGSHVEIFVSKGVQLLSVPMLKGLTASEAAAKLQAIGFKAGQATSYYSSAAKGTVFDYLGSDGSRVGLGSSIPLKVSAGPLPKLVGLTSADAVKALQAAGAKLSDVGFSDYSDSVPTGAIMTAKPEQDPLPVGGLIQLTVSLGPTTVVLPNFKGETLAAAKLALTSLGLNVTVNTDQLQSAWGVVKVKSMSIAAGTVVKRGTLITISNK